MHNEQSEKQFESFVYKWTNLKNKKVYIGKHKGSEDDGYISSGRQFLDVYNTDPTNFKREILYRGSDSDVLRVESALIKEHIQKLGYKNVYNLTTWDYLKQWNIKCTHCGKVVDPRNDDWVAAFERKHFANCKFKEISSVMYETNAEYANALARKITKLVQIQMENPTPKLRDEIRRLRELRKEILSYK